MLLQLQCTRSLIVGLPTWHSPISFYNKRESALHVEVPFSNPIYLCFNLVWSSLELHRPLPIRCVTRLKPFPTIYDMPMYHVPPSLWHEAHVALLNFPPKQAEWRDGGLSEAQTWRHLQACHLQLPSDQETCWRPPKINMAWGFNWLELCKNTEFSP